MSSTSLPAQPRVLTLLAIGLLLVVVGRVWLALIWPVPLAVDEAQYLVWSRDLQMGYYSKPPLIAWVLSIASWGCSTTSGALPMLAGEGCVRWLQPLAIGVAGLLVFSTAQELFHRLSVSVWASLFFLLAPLASFYSQAATTDAWLLLWWSAALWAFVRGLAHDERQLIRSGSASTGLRWWVLCGVFSGLGLLTKYSMGVFAVSALIVLIRQRRLTSSGPWISALIALLILAPNLIWNQHWGWPTFAHHADITLGQDRGLHPAGLLSFFGTQWLTFGPVVFGMFLWASLRRLGRGLAHRIPYDQQTNEGISLLLAFTWPILFVVLVQSLLSRAHANWASPALVGMSLVVAVWWLTESASRGNRLPGSSQLGIWLSLLINLLVLALILFSPWLVQSWGLAGQRQTDPFVRLTGYKATAQVLAQLKPAQPQASRLLLASDDRKLLATLSAYLPTAKVYAFNPRREKDNHWQLQCDLRQLPSGTNLLLVQSRRTPGFPTPTAAVFQSAQPLAATHAELASQLQSIRLEGKADLGVMAHWVTLGDGPAQ